MMQAQDFPLISHSPKRWAEFLRTRTPILESIVPLKDENRSDWNSLGNDRIIAHANWLVRERGIRNRHGLRGEDNALALCLRRRGLLDKVSFPEKQEHRRWGNDEELLAFAQEYIDSNGITNGNKLDEADRGMVSALRKRRLLDKLNFRERRELRRWGTDGQLIEAAKRHVRDNGIRNPRQFRRAFRAMYSVLETRGLLGEVGFESMQVKRSWGTNAEIMKYAAEVIKDGCLSIRSQLQKRDEGLYRILLKRGLLDAVFARFEQSAHKMAVEEVLDGIDSFKS